MALRTIAHTLFRYVDAGGVERAASRGQRVDIPSAEVTRGVALGALVEPDVPPVLPPTTPSDGTGSPSGSATSASGRIVYVWSGSAFVLGPGQTDDGVKPREFVGGSTSPLTAVANFVPRAGDTWVH